MTRFCAGEDSWLARSNNMTKSPGNSDTKDNNGRSRRNKHKRHINGETTEDTAVNAGFRGSKPSRRKKPFKRNTPGPSSLDRIVDRTCQIHGTPEQPANHTNRDCWVFKQAGKLSAETEFLAKFRQHNSCKCSRRILGHLTKDFVHTQHHHIKVLRPS